MRAIQSYLPNPRHVEVHRIYVNAKTEMAWQAARHFDGATIPWVRMIFDLRDIPDLLRRHIPEAADRGRLRLMSYYIFNSNSYICTSD